MEKKYYTPSLDDLREGYEFEYQVYEEEKDEYTDEWETMIFDSRAGLGHDMTHSFSDGRVRVPYFDMDQLKNEGWLSSKFVDRSYGWISMEFLEKESSRNFKPGPDSWCADCSYITYYVGFYKGYGVGQSPIKVLKQTTGGFAGGEKLETIFYGDCLTVNEFRTLCKWLKIK